MRKLKIGIVGCGAIGSGVAGFIERKLSAKAQLAALCDIDHKVAQSLKFKLKSKAKILGLKVLVSGVDLVIEAASQAAAKEVLKQANRFKKDVIILSVGALIKYAGIFQQAKLSGINIYIPSGAVCGIDGLSALSLGKIKELTLTTAKPPLAFKGADYLKRKKISIENIKKPQIIFKGSMLNAVKYFPQNINVAATIFLSTGMKNIKVLIKADPALKRNIHRIEAVAKEANIKIEVENFPCLENPKTSYLTVLSLENLLKKLTSNLKIGS